MRWRMVLGNVAAASLAMVTVIVTVAAASLLMGLQSTPLGLLGLSLAAVSGGLSLLAASYPSWGREEPPGLLLGPLLGFVLAFLTLGAFIGYDRAHPVLFGDRVDTLVTDRRCPSGGQLSCSRGDLRLLDLRTERDLGWVPLPCDPPRVPVVGDTTAVYVEATGIFHPLPVVCTGEATYGKVTVGLWSGVAGAALLLRVGGDVRLAWRTRRTRRAAA